MSTPEEHWEQFKKRVLEQIMGGIPDNVTGTYRYKVVAQINREFT